MAKGSIIRALLRMKHSPAGKKYLERKKKRIAEVRGFSPRTKRQLSYLSDVDRKAVLETLRGKK